MKITSAQNPRVKQLKRLRNRRGRDKSGRVLIEGYRELLRAFEFGYPVHELYVCPELFIGENEPELIRRYQTEGAEIVELTAGLFRRVAYRDRPEGLIGIGPQIHRHPSELDLGPAPLVVVVEAVEKPGNLGTILRSADAAGACGLIVCDACTDVYNPNVVRASTGALFSVPVAEADSATALEWLRDNGVQTLAATPHAESLYTDADMKRPTAIVVGTEQYGLSEFWMNHADVQVRIPMLGRIDSLNVATATTLLLYEAIRQRRA